MPTAAPGRVWRVAEALEYGIVGINTGLIWRDERIGNRPRTLQIRPRGIPRSEILVCRRYLAFRTMQEYGSNRREMSRW